MANKFDFLRATTQIPEFNTGDVQWRQWETCVNRINDWIDEAFSLGYTYRDLEKMSGVSDTTIHRFYHANFGVSQETLLKLRVASLRTALQLKLPGF